ncbi:MAG: hypothetical protein ACRDO1_01655 [Nocardioidaceae bacterium]
MAARAGSLRVRVDVPRVRGDAVEFSWSQDVPNPFQRRNGWQIEYEGVPLGSFHRAVLWEVFLTLQLPVWARSADRVEVVLPEPLPRIVTDWWRAYHGAPHVHFDGPLTDDTTYQPARRADGSVDIAVSFGGGKDSTLALHALLETRWPEQVLMMHLVHPFSRRVGARRRRTRRARDTVIGPAAEVAGVQSQLVSTDFLSGLTETGLRWRPHVNLYTAATLPALLHHGVRAVTVSRTAAGYRIDRHAGGGLRWANPSGRPERLAALATYHRRVLGIALTAESTHYAIGELVSFGALLRLYPQAFERIVMCMGTTRRRRWCLGCAKCTEYALFSLALGYVDSSFDYDTLLAGSPHIRRLVATTGVKPGQAAWHGNRPFVGSIGTPSHFATFCHALHRLDLSQPGLQVGREAGQHLRALRDAWGNVAFPGVEAIDPAALKVATPLAREVGLRAAEAFPLSGATDGHLLVGDRRAEFAHGEAMALPHLDKLMSGWEADPVRPVRG